MKYVFRKPYLKLLARIVDAIGYAFFNSSRKNEPFKALQTATFLVVRLDHLGDILTATAVPKQIKQAYPDSRVLFLAPSWGEPLLRNNPYIDRVILYDAPWFAKSRYSADKRSLSRGDVARVLKEERVDVALSLRGDCRENYLLRQARCQRTVGYGITGGGFFLTDLVDYDTQAHESDHTKALLKRVDIDAGSALSPDIHLSEAERGSLSNRAKELGLIPNERYAAVVTRAGAPAKDWSISKMTTLLKQIANSDKKLTPVLIGSQPWNIDSKSQLNGIKLVDLGGRTSVRDLCLLMPLFSVCVGPDSGPTHLALALGVPTIFLYSGTNEFERWKPVYGRYKVFRYNVPCAPCFLSHCPIDGHPCMEGITPEVVLEAIRELKI